MAKTLFFRRWNERERSRDWIHSNSERVDSYGQPGQDILPVIKDWFCGETSGKWIWIIDNADDEDIFFREFSPSVKLPATAQNEGYAISAKEGWLPDHIHIS
jgi:hypothetical protein